MGIFIKLKVFPSKILICSILLGFISISCNEPLSDLSTNSESISTSADVTINEVTTNEQVGFIFPAISEDSQFLSVLGANREIKVWRIESGELVNKRELHFGAIGFTYDQDAHVFTEEEGSELKLIRPSRIKTPKIIDDFKVPEPNDISTSYFLSLSPDQMFLAGYTPYLGSSSINENIEFNIWDLETHKSIVTLTIPSTTLDESAFFYPRFPISTGFHLKGMQFFSADGQWVLAPKPNSIEIWDLRTASKHMEIEAISATFSPKPNILISENYQQVQSPEGSNYIEASDIQVWDLNTKRPVVNLGTGILSFTADGDHFVFYDRQTNEINLFDTLSGKKLHSIESNFISDNNLFFQIAISGDGRWVAGIINEISSSSGDSPSVRQTLILCDVQTGKVLGEPKAVNNPNIPFQVIRLFEFTPDGKHLLLGKDYGHEGALVENLAYPLANSFFL